jgi:hypothetical protein
MVASAICTLLALPGDLIRHTLNAMLGNPVFTLIVLIGLVFLFGLITVITSFEILELVPILSFMIDWLELLTLSPIGPIVYIYLAISLGISYGVIPCTGLF